MDSKECEVKMGGPDVWPRYLSQIMMHGINLNYIPNVLWRNLSSQLVPK